jgi:hypothetical protein
MAFTSLGQLLAQASEAKAARITVTARCFIFPPDGVGRRRA